MGETPGPDAVQRLGTDEVEGVPPQNDAKLAHGGIQEPVPHAVPALRLVGRTGRDGEHQAHPRERRPCTPERANGRGPRQWQEDSHHQEPREQGSRVGPNRPEAEKPSGRSKVREPS